MKQYLLKLKVGHFALDLRDKVEIISTAIFKPEAVGTIANDQLATYLVTRLCKNNGVFIDVGAHIGSVISEVKRNCNPQKIHAIEAIPKKAFKLQRVFENVAVHNFAAGDRESEVSFFENTKQSGYSSLIRPSGDTTIVKELKVPLRKLDGMVPHQDVDVIKIDVEGAELGVLKGAVNVIASSRPVIMFESGVGEKQIKAQIMQFFQECDYVVLVPNRLAHNDPGLDLNTFLEGHLYPRRTTNYFAVPRERQQEIRDRARSILIKR